MHRAPFTNHDLICYSHAHYHTHTSTWSITPGIYAWGFALHPLIRGETTPTDLPFDRLTVMAALATLWGIRLTYNFARKVGDGNIRSPMPSHHASINQPTK